MTDGISRASVGTCPECGKRRFLSKADVKAVLRKLRTKGRQHPYRCGDYWHHGHMPARVKGGAIARDQLQPKARP